MKIKDIKDNKIKELALLRQEEAGILCDENAKLSYSQESFSWNSTKEGFDFWNDVDDGVCVKDSEHYPKENFIMPKTNWHVVVTKENQKMLSDWRFSDDYEGEPIPIGYVVGNCGGDGKNHNGNLGNYGFGIEITTEQFKKHVLKMEEPKFRIKGTVIPEIESEIEFRVKDWGDSTSNEKRAFQAKHISFGHTEFEGDIYIHIEKEDYNGSLYWMVKEKDLVEIDNKQKLHNTKETMKRTFPITITKEQAESIIDIACGEWKEKLIDQWSTQILVDKEVVVKESYYKVMRKACEHHQNELFDEIFGKDVEEVDFKIGDHVITDGYCDVYDGRVLKITYINSRGYCNFDVLDGVHLYKRSNFHKDKKTRFATPEEIKEAKKDNFPKEGEVCKVWVNGEITKYIRVSNGNDGFYYNGRLVCDFDSNKWDNFEKLGVNIND